MLRPITPVPIQPKRVVDGAKVFILFLVIRCNVFWLARDKMNEIKNRRTKKNHHSETQIVPANDLHPKGICNSLAKKTTRTKSAELKSGSSSEF
jgi:hypothetical protein